MSLKKKIIIGTAQLDKNYGLNKNRNKITVNEINNLFEFLKKNQYFYLDTAKNYKDSENLLKKINLNKFKIIGKIEKLRNKKNIYNYLKKEILNSINNLGIKMFEGYLIHDEKDLISNRSDEIYRALVKIKKENLTKKIGISIYDFKKASSIIKSYKLDIIQLPYNLIDRRLENKSFLKLLEKRNLEIHVRSIFLQGLLLKDLNKVPKIFYKYLKFFKKIDKYCKKNLLSKLEACLNFVMSNKVINKIIIGIENKSNMVEINNIKIRKFKFPKTESKDINLIDPRKWKKS